MIIREDVFPAGLSTIEAYSIAAVLISSNLAADAFSNPSYLPRLALFLFMVFVEDGARSFMLRLIDLGGVPAALVQIGSVFAMRQRAVVPIAGF